MYNSILCPVRPAGARYRFCIFRKEYTTMKQFTKIAVVCALAVSLAACGSSASSTAASSAASSEAASSVAASSEAASEAASSEAASVAEGEGYTGTQTASAKGMNGDVTVTITFENGVATACDVDASTETESLGQAAAPTVADAIVAGNTPNVDAVSGSTVTSNAIMEAAKACYDAAGIAY